MKQLSAHKVGLAAALATSLLAAGCQRNAVSSYEIPKEDYAPKLAMARPGERPPGAPQAAKIRWQTPEGWIEKPAESMRVGSFSIPGPDGKSAEVRITPLPETAEMVNGTIGMWRSELGLPPEAIGFKPQEVDAAGLKASLYDFTSVEPKFDGKLKSRLVAAILPRAGTMWFIRMSGEESIVAREQDKFRAFLNGLTFEQAPTPPSTVAAAPSATGSKPSWKIPSTWTEKTPGPMVMTAYTAEGVDITVTALDGPAGGVLGNANRWRGQFGVPPMAPADVEKEIKTIELADQTKAYVVDIKGTNPKTQAAGRLYGLIVPRGAQTWFYKMTGEPAGVAAETAHLAEFAATAH